MDSVLWLIGDFAAALLASLVLCRLWMLVTFKDAPTEARKAEVHAGPVPTSGGVPFAVAGLAATVGFAQLAGYNINLPVFDILVGGAAMAVLGWIDDRFGVDAIIKLAIIIAVTLAMTMREVRTSYFEFWPGLHWLAPFPIAVGLWVLWLVVIVNAVNFMDGANGLSIGMAAVAAAGLAICGIIAEGWDVTLAALALAGAFSGFLVWNVSGKLFAGDAGALFAGLMLGGLSIEVIRLRPDWLYVPPTLLLPFLSDVLLTLAWRARHGKPLFSAHRDHAYQIAMKAGMKHWQVAAVHAFWALNALLFGVAGAVIGGWAPLAAFLTLLLVSVLVHMRVRSHGVKAGLVGADVA